MRYPTISYWSQGRPTCIANFLLFLHFHDFLKNDHSGITSYYYKIQRTQRYDKYPGQQLTSTLVFVADMANKLSRDVIEELNLTRVIKSFRGKDVLITTYPEEEFNNAKKCREIHCLNKYKFYLLNVSNLKIMFQQTVV